MQPALYFCTGELELEEYWHYALGVQYYTHFTSPIRRYADVIVHRLLEMAIGYRKNNPQKLIENDQNPANSLELKGFEKEKISEIAEHCNLKKKLAKSAQEASARLFLCLYIKRFGEIVCEGIISECREKAFTVIFNDYGVERRFHYNELQEVYDANISLVENQEPLAATVHFVMPNETPETEPDALPEIETEIKQNFIYQMKPLVSPEIAFDFSYFGNAVYTSKPLVSEIGLFATEKEEERNLREPSKELSKNGELERSPSKGKPNQKEKSKDKEPKELPEKEIPLPRNLESQSSSSSSSSNRTPKKENPKVLMAVSSGRSSRKGRVEPMKLHIFDKVKAKIFADLSKSPVDLGFKLLPKEE